MNYIVICFKQEKVKSDILIDFLKGLLGNVCCSNISNNLIVSYQLEEDINFKEIANMIVDDFYLDITLLDINSSNIDYVNSMIELYNKIENKSYIYLNDKDIITKSSKLNNDNIKKEILKEFYYDSEMLNIIKVFLENDLNISSTSTLLYLHRNTLTNKIDKFIKITNYDIRKFKDSYIIYKLIK